MRPHTHLLLALHCAMPPAQTHGTATTTDDEVPLTTIGNRFVFGGTLLQYLNDANATSGLRQSTDSLLRPKMGQHPQGSRERPH